MLIQVLLVKTGPDWWSFPNVTKHRFEGSSYCTIRAVSLCAGYEIPLPKFHNEDLIQDTVIDIFFFFKIWWNNLNDEICRSVKRRCSFILSNTKQVNITRPPNKSALSGAPSALAVELWNGNCASCSNKRLTLKNRPSVRQELLKIVFRTSLSKACFVCFLDCSVFHE